jgi:hypothetical protein
MSMKFRNLHARLLDQRMAGLDENKTRHRILMEFLSTNKQRWTRIIHEAS